LSPSQSPSLFIVLILFGIDWNMNQKAAVSGDFQRWKPADLWSLLMVIAGKGSR